MAINYSALKSEIQTDPLVYGYAAHVASGNDEAIATLLNAIRTGSDGLPAITVRRSDIAPVEVLEAIGFADLVSPSNTLQTAWFESITQYPTIQLVNADGTNTRVISNLFALVNNPSPSRNRINAIANRNGSRAEQLFGVNTSITSSDVARALRAT